VRGRLRVGDHDGIRRDCPQPAEDLLEQAILRKDFGIDKCCQFGRTLPEIGLLGQARADGLNCPRQELAICFLALEYLSESQIQTSDPRE